MAKLVLVNAGKNYEYGILEPLHLLGLAAYAKKFGHEVAVADQIAGEDIFQKIEKLKPDFVGITATTAVIADAYDIADWCRAKGYKTILGGVHVSLMPDEALKHGDFVVVGEGENALIEILEGKVKKGVVKCDYIKNLDSLPKIDRSLINVKYYQKAKDRNPGAHLHFVPPNTKLNSVMGARGCPYNCIFCHNSWRGMPVRVNSAKRIVEEIKEIEKKYGTEAIFFMDDNFLFPRNRAMEFCRLYKEEGLKIKWGCQAMVTSVDRELLKELKSVNCKQIMFGFESGNQRILSLVKNNTTTVEQNRKAIEIVKEAGILASGNFIIGNPTETEEEINDTKRFILENKPDGFGVTISTPFPGTKLWKMCEEKGVIPEKINWRDFNLSNPTLNLSNVSYEKLQEFWQYFLNLTLERNPSMTAKNILKVAFKHPGKAVKRLIKDPRSFAVIFRRMIRWKN